MILIPLCLCSTKLVCLVVLPEELQPHDGEDVDDEEEDDGEVAQRAQRVDDDGQQDPHGRPRLGQLHHSQLQK